MMMEFAQKTRRLLKVYGVISNFLGQTFLGFGILWGALYSTGIISRLGNWRAMKEEIDHMPNGIFMFIFSGLIALGVSQFIYYLIEPDYKPGRILRHGDKILLAYAVWTVGELVWAFMFSPHHQGYGFYLDVLLAVLVTAGKVLILVGLAQILRRVLPMIEETKTLV